MKKSIKAFLCLSMMAGVLAGCSSKDTGKANNNENKSTQNVEERTKKTAENTKKDVDDSIDNVMNYFKENGIAYENMQAINDMEFAAYEGRSFMMNGNNVYLYRVNSDDENMKKVLQEAKEKGKVKVRIDNKEQEYTAQVNGSYLMLYDTKGNHADLQKLFPKYQSTGVHGVDPNEDMNTSMENKEKPASTTESSDNTTPQEESAE